MGKQWGEAGLVLSAQYKAKQCETGMGRASVISIRIPVKDLVEVQWYAQRRNGPFLS